MASWKLRVMLSPPPPSRSVLTTDSRDPRFVYVRGGGHDDLVCGNCSHVLAAWVMKDGFSGHVFKCPSCGSFNDTNKIVPVE